MSVEHLEVLVEEPSMEAALEILLPKLLTSMTFSLHPHQGKSQLLRALPDKLRGYASWIPDTFRILVVVDQDNDDCGKLKRTLECAALNAGLATRSSPRRKKYRVVNRVAIEELEAWYFGDWDAVRAAYPRVNASVPVQTKYRDPDNIKGGTWEAFERVLKSAGYFKTGLRKIEAAREVTQHMDPARNTSPSFQALQTALMEMAAS